MPIHVFVRGPDVMCVGGEPESSFSSEPASARECNGAASFLCMHPVKAQELPVLQIQPSPKMCRRCHPHRP
jgi:hypothetical protein